MKIAIMTTWGYKNNYGSVLQSYALQKYLRDEGHGAYLIRYHPAIKETNIFRRLMKMANPVKEILLKLHSVRADRWRGFDEFRETYINHSVRAYYSYDELKDDPPEADLYIVGSDQVWNVFFFTEDKTRAFFLDFGDEKTRKIAWAASFGRGHLNDAMIQNVSSLMKCFEYISVREKSGVDICKKCGIENADWVIDPTLLLDADVYRSLYKNIDVSANRPKGAYCFLYLLDDSNHVSEEEIYKWAAKNGLSVVYMTGNSRYNRKNIYATIFEWLYLLENSELVITDSYHSMIFSVIFQKDFFIIPRTIEVQNDRFMSFFEMFDIEQRFINGDLTFLLQNKRMNWDGINDILDKQKRSCKMKIYNILNEHKDIKTT